MNTFREDKLKQLYIEYKILNKPKKVLIDWAISEMLQGFEEEEICILASFNENNDQEIDFYLNKLLPNKPQMDSEEIYNHVGMMIVNLRNQYFSGEITIKELDSIFDKIILSIGSLDWLVMLSRNCEYATDIDVFLKPFEDELNYIADLWEKKKSYQLFSLEYNRNISNCHDFNSK